MLQPEVIEFLKDKKALVDTHDGVYRVRWLAHSKTTNITKGFWSKLFGAKDGEKSLQIPSREETFLHDGVSIYWYPSLEKLEFARATWSEIDDAIIRYHIRKDHGLPHPFAKVLEEEKSVPGENTVEEGPFR